MKQASSEMQQRLDPPEAAAFPIRAGLRLAIALSLLLAVTGGVGFLGLLRMSALKVHKSIAIFAERTPWPGSASPAALSVRTLDNGRLSAPERNGVITVGTSRLSPAAASAQNLLFALPPIAAGSSVSGAATASALSLDAPPLAFETLAPAAVESPVTEFEAASIGLRIRTASVAEDEVPAPIVTITDSACADRVTAIPAGGVAQQFLESRLLVRVTDRDGAPRTGLRIELTASSLGAPPSRVAAAETDPFGLAELAVTLDGESAYALRWDCQGATSTAALSVPVQNDGMTADWRPEPSTGSGLLQVETADIRGRASWQADLFCGERWTESRIVEQAAGRGVATVGPIPAAATGQPCLWQASTQPYLPHPLQVGIWVLPAADTADLRTKAIALFDRMAAAAAEPLAAQFGPPSRAALAAADERQLTAATRWLLSWLPRRFEPRPMLADSAERDLSTLRDYKQYWRVRFRLMLGAAVLGLILIWLPRAIAGLLEDRRRFEAYRLSNADDGAPPVTRLRGSIGGLVLAVVLAVLAILAMVWVVS